MASRAPASAMPVTLAFLVRSVNLARLAKLMLFAPISVLAAVNLFFYCYSNCAFKFWLFFFNHALKNSLFKLNLYSLQLCVGECVCPSNRVADSPSFASGADVTCNECAPGLSYCRYLILFFFSSNRCLCYCFICSGFYGPDCARCASCNSRGVCVDGAAGDGTIVHFWYHFLRSVFEIFFYSLCFIFINHFLPWL